MEGDDDCALHRDSTGISTHALTWRATRKVFEREQRQMISTHALTWRATRSKMTDLLFREFLPTPSHGGRRTILFLPPGDVRDFYPRPHMEGDERYLPMRQCYPNFYPRPHMEGDRDGYLCQECRKYDFYPRPHMEGDTRILLGKRQDREFLPTPSHGGRPVNSCLACITQIDFYPRPHMEGDPTTRNF